MAQGLTSAGVPPQSITKYAAWDTPLNMRQLLKLVMIICSGKKRRFSTIYFIHVGETAVSIIFALLIYYTIV